ncbi:MAG: WYL domain-containing protein [Faecousia sp.]
MDDDVEDIVRVLIRDELHPKRENTPQRTLPRWEIPDSAKTMLGTGVKAREHDLLFNEIFCIYYYVIADVFVRLSSSATEKSYSKQEILQAIEDSFTKFRLLIGQETKFLLPNEILKLLVDGGFLERIDRPIPDAYETVKNKAGTGFIRKQKTEKAYVSKYVCDPNVELYRDVVPLTILELRWLKTIVRDQKMKLFFSGDEITLLQNLLDENAPSIKALPMNKVVFFDRFRFTEKNARRETAVLATILEGIYDQRTVRLKYHTNQKGPRHGEFRPIVLEFSKRNNRFQGYFQNCKTNAILTINIAQIETATETGTAFDYSAAEIALAEYRKNNTTSVEIEFSNVKNIVDRILTEFSPWEKRCSYDAKTRKYRLTIFYQKPDELDLVVRLLGYGAYLRFVDKEHPIFKEIQLRMQKQMELIEERRKNSNVQEPGDNR